MAGRRELDVSLIRARRAAMIDREQMNREKHENREIGKEPRIRPARLQDGGEEMALCRFFASYGVASYEHRHRKTIATIWAARG